MGKKDGTEIDCMLTSTLRISQDGNILGYQGIFRDITDNKRAEAMASHRPYRPARKINMALAEISRHRKTIYDPVVVDACLKLFQETGFQFD